VIKDQYLEGPKEKKGKKDAGDGSNWQCGSKGAEGKGGKSLVTCAVNKRRRSADAKSLKLHFDHRPEKRRVLAARGSSQL